MYLVINQIGIEIFNILTKNDIMNKLQIIETIDYVLAVSDEEIKENTNTFKEGINGDWFWNSKYNTIQRTGDITCFDFKIEAHQPKNNAPELDLPLLPEMVLEDDVENQKWYKDAISVLKDEHSIKMAKMCLKAGYKAATKIYSEEDIIKLMSLAWNAGFKKHDVVEAGLEGKETDSEVRWILSKFKSSKTPKWVVAETTGGGEYLAGEIGGNEIWAEYPTELKTTTINGKTYLVGTYLYE